MNDDNDLFHHVSGGLFFVFLKMLIYYYFIKNISNFLILLFVFEIELRTNSQRQAPDQLPVTPQVLFPFLNLFLLTFNFLKCEKTCKRTVSNSEQQ